MNALSIIGQRGPFVCSLIGLVVIALSAPAIGQVRYFGCGGMGSDFDFNCSLAELNNPPPNPMDPVLCPPIVGPQNSPLKKIVISDTMFHGFSWQPGFQTGGPPLGSNLSEILVEGTIDSEFQPGLKFTATNDAWTRDVFTVSLNTMSFNICRTGGHGSPIFDRKLSADFGLINGHDTSEQEDSSVFIKDRMIVRLDSGNTTANLEESVQCFASHGPNWPDLPENGDQEALCSNMTLQGEKPGNPPQPFARNYNMTSVVELSLIAETAALNGHSSLKEFRYELEVGPFTGLAAVSNIGDSGAPELGVALSGSLNGQIRDASSDGLIRNLTYNGSRTPVDIGVADINGSPALAVLVQNQTTNVAWVEVRDALTDTLVKDVWFPIGFTPIALAVMPDMNGNNVSELAVLMTKDSDGRTWVHIKDASTLASINSVWFPTGYEALDLEFVPNVDGNPGPELAVLTTKDADGRAWVLVKDAQTGNYVKSVWFEAGYTPRDLAVIHDLDTNGASELAVLMRRDIDERAWVHMKDALTGSYVRNEWFSPGFSPSRLEIVPDLDGNFRDELAVLMTKDADGRAWVHVRDPSILGLVREVWFQGTFAPKDFAVLANMDANPGSELAVLGVTNGGLLQVEIKDANTRAFINLVNFP